MEQAEKKKIKAKKIPEGRRNYPVKRSINLAAAGEKKTNMTLAIPLIILIIVAAAAFSKFMVADRIAEASAASARVTELQQQLEDTYAQINEMNETVTEEYAHYSYSGMTEEELSAADREEVVELIDRYVMPYASVTSWHLSENTLTMPITGTSLEEINEIVDRLNSADLVDFCTFTTAATGDSSQGEKVSDVTTAELVIYLNSAVSDQTEESPVTVIEEGGQTE